MRSEPVSPVALQHALTWMTLKSPQDGPPIAFPWEVDGKCELVEVGPMAFHANTCYQIFTGVQMWGKVDASWSLFNKPWHMICLGQASRW